MFKFLRKYSVWILAVGGTLLLIAFLAPNVITEFSRRAGYSGTVQATVGPDAEAIGFNDWQQVVAEAQVVDRLGPSLPGLGSVASPGHWFLLTREAAGAGLTPAPQAVVIDQVTLANISRGAGASPQLILQTLANLQGVQRLLTMYRSAARFSDTRLHAAAGTLLSAVAVETIAIEANGDGDLQPSDADLQAHLDAYGDLLPGEGDHGFGYRLGDRATIEWLIIPADSIREAAAESDRFSSREQRKYWRRNEADPRFPAITAGAEIPDVVSSTFLDEIATSDTDTLARAAAEMLRLPRRGFDELDGVLQLPEHWLDAQLPLTALAARMQDEHGTICQIATSGGLIDPGALAEIDALSTAAMRGGGQLVTLTDLVYGSAELSGGGSIPVQTNVAGPVLETAGGDLVIFRLTAADASRPPANVDEVRDSLVTDLRRLAHWDILLASSDAIEQQARDQGMLQVAIDHRTTVSRPRPVSLADTGIPTILGPEQRYTLMAQQLLQKLAAGDDIEAMASAIDGLDQRDAAAIEAIVARSGSLPLDVPISELTSEDSVYVIPSETNLALVVVRVTGTTPASTELAQALSAPTNPILQSMLSLEELGGIDAISDAFSFEVMAQRHQFRRGSSDTNGADES